MTTHCVKDIFILELREKYKLLKEGGGRNNKYMYKYSKVANGLSPKLDDKLTVGRIGITIFY